MKYQEMGAHSTMVKIVGATSQMQLLLLIWAWTDKNRPRMEREVRKDERLNTLYWFLVLGRFNSWCWIPLTFYK